MKLSLINYSDIHVCKNRSEYAQRTPQVSICNDVNLDVST
jgi:hypothetical protein